MFAGLSVWEKSHSMKFIHQYCLEKSAPWTARKSSGTLLFVLWINKKMFFSFPHCLLSSDEEMQIKCLGKKGRAPSLVYDSELYSLDHTQLYCCLSGRLKICAECEKFQCLSELCQVLCIHLWSILSGSCEGFLDWNQIRCDMTSAYSKIFGIT